MNFDERLFSVFFGQFAPCSCFTHSVASTVCKCHVIVSHESYTHELLRNLQNEKYLSKRSGGKELNVQCSPFGHSQIRINMRMNEFRILIRLKRRAEFINLFQILIMPVNLAVVEIARMLTEK